MAFDVRAAALAAWAVAGVACAQGVPPLVTPQLQTGAGWTFVGLPNQTKPVTRFTAERVEPFLALRIDANESYGNWVHNAATPLPLRQLRWQWRVEAPNPKTDLTKKGGDDVPARVCVSFAMPHESLSFFERQKLALARAATGMDISPATLCYVWGAQEARGSLLDSAFTRRLRQIVLRNRDDASRTWFEEKRDLAADFARAFGDEAQTFYPVSAVIVGGDADNTHQHSIAFIAELRAMP